MKLDKNFQVAGMNYTLSLMVNNLFNTINIESVDGATGMANTSVNFENRIMTGLPTDFDPTNYGPGRQILVGLSVKF